MNENEESTFKSGFVAVLGYANVGKSTLVNSLVGSKVTIVSPRPQTTRHRIMGILHRPDAQVVFLDTPGIHEPQDRLGEGMLRGARDAVIDVDMTLLVVDASRTRPGSGDSRAADICESAGAPTILVVNKIDDIPTEEREDRIARYARIGDFDVVVPVSALRGWNLDTLLSEILERLPAGGPRYFPEDTVTDRPTTFLASELVRERVFYLTKEEVPHCTTVVVREAEERPGPILYLAMDIVVERASQRGILIGRGGKMIKRIGETARSQVEELLGIKVYLDLYVRVEKGWRDDPRALDELGFSDHKRDN
ncbi:MAG: GTPase Era [Bacillota bacterium]